MPESAGKRRGRALDDPSDAVGSLGVRWGHWMHASAPNRDRQLALTRRSTEERVGGQGRRDTIRRDGLPRRADQYDRQGQRLDSLRWLPRGHRWNAVAREHPRHGGRRDAGLVGEPDADQSGSLRVPRRPEPCPDLDAAQGLPVLPEGRGPRDHAADPAPGGGRWQPADGSLRRPAPRRSRADPRLTARARGDERRPRGGRQTAGPAPERPRSPGFDTAARCSYSPARTARPAGPRFTPLIR